MPVDQDAVEVAVAEVVRLSRARRGWRRNLEKYLVPHRDHGANGQQRPIDSPGGQVFTGATRDDGMAFSLEALDGLHAEQAHGTMWPAVDGELAVFVALEAVNGPTHVRPTGEIRHSARRDVDLHDTSGGQMPRKLWRRSRAVGQLYDVHPFRRALDAPALVSGRSQTFERGVHGKTSFMCPPID